MNYQGNNSVNLESTIFRVLVYRRNEEKSVVQISAAI